MMNDQMYYNTQQQATIPNNDQYYYNNSNIQSNNTQQQTNYYRKKPTGIGSYHATIFTHMNPKNAIIQFKINTKSGELCVCMSPAIPNNSAIGIRGPVPPGTKVYDYSKEIFTNFSSTEPIELLAFLKDKYRKNLSGYADILMSINSEIKNMKNQMGAIFTNEFFMKLYQGGALSQECATQLYNAFSTYITKLNDLINRHQSLLNGSSSVSTKATENQFSMYRKHSSGDKVWNFTYDNASNMLHISMMFNKDKDNRVHISLSANAANNLLCALESYVNNISIIQMMSDVNCALSKTLAHNNLLMPDTQIRDNYA